MKKTGTLLKVKRESANLSLSEVALATKINPKILAAIENGDETALPAKTFLKGFIRSYALFLKMDVEEVLRTFQEETGGAPKERVHEAYRNDHAPNGSGSRRRVGEENSSGLRTAAVAVIVILIGLIIGVRELIEKYQREKVVESTETLKVSPLLQTPAPAEVVKAADSSTPTPTTAPTPTPTSAPAPAPTPAAQALTNQNVPAQVAVAAVSPPPPLPPLPPLPPAPAKAESKPAQVKPAATSAEPSESKEAKPSKAETQANDAKPEKSKAVNSEIILEALDNVDVKMQFKGETKRFSLGPTQVHTVHAHEAVTFDFSDGGAVSIILNGRERGPVGELGKPKQITVP